MKIGFVADDTLDKPDGVQQYILAVGKWLREQGHEVHYLVGQSSRVDVPNVHSLSKNVAVTFNGNRLSIPLPAPRKAIRELLAKEQFDVLHVQTPHSPFLAQRVVCAASDKTKIIATFHILPHNRITAWLNRLLAVWLRPSLRRIDQLIAVSSAAKDFAEKIYGLPAQVIPNAIDLQPFLAATPNADVSKIPTILYLNRLEPRKGCLYLLQAVDQVVHTLGYKPKFQVVICGKGSQAQILKDYVAAHKLEAVVRFTGFLAEAAKPSYIAASDIAVYPSTGGESFGIVLLEGLAACHGVVLGGDNPGYSTVLAPFPAQLFDPKDTPAFAKLLVKHLDNPNARTKIAEKQRQYAQSFDVAVVGQKLLAVYMSSS